MATSDVEVAVDVLERFYPGIRLGAVRDERFGFGFDAFPMSGLAVLHFTLAGMRSRNRFDAAGTFQAGLLTVDEGEVSSGREAYDLTEPVLFHGRLEATSTRSENLVLQFDPAELSEFARLASGDERLVLATTGRAALTPSTARMWRSTLAHVHAIAQIPDAAANPVLAQSTFDFAATVFLHAFPTTWLHHRGPGQRRPAPAGVDRAVDYIEAHAGDPIGVTDIAAAAGLTLRGLHSEFRRQLGVTLREYLRQVRLDRARTELLTADPATASVAAIARRWGFGNPGRFTARYVAAYGVPPEHDLYRP